MSEPLDMLLVEDDEVFASVLQRSLVRRGHRVQWAADLAAAQQALAEQAFSHAYFGFETRSGVQPATHSCAAGDKR